MTDRSRIKTVTQIKSNQPCENKRQALSQIKRIDWNSLDFRTLNISDHTLCFKELVAR